MRKAVFVAFLLMLGSAVLGATVLHEPFAWAATPFQNVIVANTDDMPVPVKQQGSIALTGTADVNVTNSSLSVTPQPPVTEGGNFFQADGGQTANFGSDLTASALMVTFTAAAFSVSLRNDGQTVAFFFGPASVTGNRSYQLALNRPVSFDSVACTGPASETCGISWVGNKP